MPGAVTREQAATMSSEELATVGKQFFDARERTKFVEDDDEDESMEIVGGKGSRPD